METIRAFSLNPKGRKNPLEIHSSKERSAFSRGTSNGRHHSGRMRPVGFESRFNVTDPQNEQRSPSSSASYVRVAPQVSQRKPMHPVSTSDFFPPSPPGASRPQFEQKSSSWS